MERRDNYRGNKDRDGDGGNRGYRGRGEGRGGRGRGDRPYTANQNFQGGQSQLVPG